MTSLFFTRDTPVPDSADIVIVGGGIVGIASAWFLSRAGIRAVVLESAEDIGLRTTAMSAHCIRAQFSEPDNIQMMAESLSFYEEIAQHCGLPPSPGIGLRQQGYLFASTEHSAAESISARVTGQRAAGLTDVEFLDGDDLRQRHPWLSTKIIGGSFRARDGWIDSSLAIKALATTAGLAIHTGVTVTSITVEREKVAGVATTRGNIATDTVILAAGPFSRRLSPEPLPITLLRRHRLIVSPHPGIPQHGPVTIDADTGAHWRPHHGGALTAWAQPEDDAEAVWPVPPDPGFVDRVLRSGDGIGRLAPFWRDLAKGLKTSQILLTAGQYTVTPDHRPLIGPSPATKGLYLHTGYSGHGIMGAPAGARLLADMVSGSLGAANPFDPRRFGKGFTPPDVERVVI